LAVDGTLWAMAQMKPARSQAIAAVTAVTTLAVLPLQASLQ